MSSQAGGCRFILSWIPFFQVRTCRIAGAELDAVGEGRALQGAPGRRQPPSLLWEQGEGGRHVETQWEDKKGTRVTLLIVFEGVARTLNQRILNYCSREKYSRVLGTPGNNIFINQPMQNLVLRVFLSKDTFFNIESIH